MFLHEINKRKKINNFCASRTGNLRLRFNIGKFKKKSISIDLYHSIDSRQRSNSSTLEQQ